MVGIRPDDRAVIVGTAADLDGDTVRIEELNWLSPPLGPGDRCLVQVRYRSRAVPAVVRSVDVDSVVLDLEIPARAITPGQSGVLYSDQNQVLGGGVIG